MRRRDLLIGLGTLPLTACATPAVTGQAEPARSLIRVPPVHVRRERILKNRGWIAAAPRRWISPRTGTLSRQDHCSQLRSWRRWRVSVLGLFNISRRGGGEGWAQASSGDRCRRDGAYKCFAACAPGLRCDALRRSLSAAYDVEYRWRFDPNAKRLWARRRECDRRRNCADQ